MKESKIDYEEDIILNDVSDIELYYLNLARKMPFDYIWKDIENYRKHWFITDEVKYIEEMMKKYSCTKKELYDRIKIVHKIKRYSDKKNSLVIKKQKRMTKTINKNKI